MAGISRFEKGVLLLTAGFVLFAGGWFLAGTSSPEPYTITVSSQESEPPAPDPALENKPASGERPDSLLPDEVININTADTYDLDRLPGIGPTKAEAILAYREEHGAFGSTEEIMQVSGIGQGTFDKIKDEITV